MNKMQYQVREFHELVIKDNPPKYPIRPEHKVISLRSKLMREELTELEDALYIGSFEEVCKELADLLYVVLGTVCACGIDIEPIFDEVHRSNMTKLGGPIREDGKMLKPDTYEEANLVPIIKAQLIPEQVD